MRHIDPRDPRFNKGILRSHKQQEHALRIQ